MRGTHLCLIYHDEEERRNILSKFFWTAKEEWEFFIYLTDSLTPGDTLDWLVKKGNHRLRKTTPHYWKILPAVPTLCPADRFEPGMSINQFCEKYTDSILRGYKGLRISAEMSWATRGVADWDSLIRYETMINQIKEDFPITFLCQYDASRFNRATLYKIIMAHPYLIQDGKIIRNLCFSQKKVDRKVNDRIAVCSDSRK